MMEPKGINKMNTYHILVKEIQDYHINEWFGRLTLVPQENGETFLDISFTGQEELPDSQDQPWDHDITVLSIEYIENEDLQVVEA
jgi:hypothetical protein